MIALASKILDIDGKPYRKRADRHELDTLRRVANGPSRLQATYDAAGSSNEFSNYWANADHYDADSSNSRDVRRKLVSRSRYEVSNNGFADGIAQTYATDVVGVGPTLRMQTGSTAFNQLIEREFMLWAKAIKLRAKLWCMCHAKHQDGEAFAVARTNPSVRHPVMLDVVLYETEQCQSPWMGFKTVGYIDGIKYDDFGNPLWYDFLQEHPGSGSYYKELYDPEQVPARYVMHWFKMRRPGQHRGIPECTSTLQTGAAARRWREATIAAAETAAEFTMLMKTTLSPDEIDVVSPMSTLEIQKRMMTALPMGYDPFQMKAEHPNSTFSEFHKAQINEQARPKSMPYNKAACDSSSYNYASGRLDHQTYYAALDVDREDGNDLVLDPLFDVWFDEAIRVNGWLGGDPATITPAAKIHTWDWPKHRVADVESEANANNTNLRNGTLSPSKLASDAGEDYEDKVVQLAADLGVTVQQMKQVLLFELYPQGAKAVFMPSALGAVEPIDPEDATDTEDTTDTQEPANGT